VYADFMLFIGWFCCRLCVHRYDWC